MWYLKGAIEWCLYYIFTKMFINSNITNEFSKNVKILAKLEYTDTKKLNN